MDPQLIWIKRLFAISAFIACFTCYARPDYNLPLFAFAYLLWDQQKPSSQKTRLIYLIIFTAVFDLIWLLYWWPFWEGPDFDKNWAKGIQTFVIFLSLINFIIKIGTIALCWKENEVKQALTPEGFKQNIMSVISSNQNQQNQHAF